MKCNGCGRVEGGHIHDARMCDGCTWSVSRDACEDFRYEYDMTMIRLSVTVKESDDHE